MAPDKLEQAYKSTRGITDIFIYGESTKSCLIAVIHSEEPDLKKIASEVGVNGSMEEMCENDGIKKWFVAALEDMRKEQGLKGFERIVKVHLTPESFEKQDLLTTTFKTKRNVAQDHFKEQLDKMYEGLD